MQRIAAEDAAEQCGRGPVPGDGDGELGEASSVLHLRPDIRHLPAQPGLFQVWAKLERDNMTGGIPGEDGNFYFLGDVPSVLYFDQARALHGTYWHAKFGTPTSRGCVNLAPTDANWVFDFAEVGTWVHVFDPSGNTPTDPSVYGAGGA